MSVFKHSKFSVVIKDAAKAVGRTGLNKDDSRCSKNSFLIGDMVCDEVTNNVECLYDGGDCCLEDTDKDRKFCSICTCYLESKPLVFYPLDF